MIAALRHLLLTILWLVVIAVLSLGSAGVVARWSHPPGTPARVELTWARDRTLVPTLDAARVDLEALAADVDRLSVLARGALGAMTAVDREPFDAALTEGASTARRIELASGQLRTGLLALPGDSASDSLDFSAFVLSRRAAMLDAIDSTEGLGRSWASLTAGSLSASNLITLLTDHDLTVAAAAADGRAARYAEALVTLGRATAALDSAAKIRDQLANASDVTTLDRWLSRNRRYDAALTGLYAAFRDSGGTVTDAVRAAFTEESAARAILPPDTRGLVLIVADIGRGGLNQAVIAIEQARARLNLALEALASVSRSAT